MSNQAADLQLHLSVNVVGGRPFSASRGPSAAHDSACCSASSSLSQNFCAVHVAPRDHGLSGNGPSANWSQSCVLKVGRTTPGIAPVTTPVQQAELQNSRCTCTVPCPLFGGVRARPTTSLGRGRRESWCGMRVVGVDPVLRTSWLCRVSGVGVADLVLVGGGRAIAER